MTRNVQLLSRGKAHIARNGHVFDNTQTCVEPAQNFGKNLGLVSHSQKIIVVTLEHRGA